MSSSPSFNVMAARPVFLIFSNASIFVFLTIPFFVAIMRYFLSKPVIGMIAVTFSFGRS